MELTSTQSIKSGNTIIKETGYGGQFVAQVRKVNGKYFCRLSPSFLGRTGLKQNHFKSVTLGGLVQAVENYINSRRPARSQ